MEEWDEERKAKKIITKTRKKDNIFFFFRAFVLSCFRDQAFLFLTLGLCHLFVIWILSFVI